MADAFRMRISVEGVEDKDIVARLQDLRPAFDSLRTFIDKAGNYTRPDRLRGDQGRPGEIATWAPGYRPYHKLRRTKRKVRLDSRRPYHPAFTAEAEDDLVERLTRYILTGST